MIELGLHILEVLFIEHMIQNGLEKFLKFRGNLYVKDNRCICYTLLLSLWGTCWVRVRLEMTELRQLGFDVEMIYSTNILSLKADLLKGANNNITISTK